MGQKFKISRTSLLYTTFPTVTVGEGKKGVGYFCKNRKLGNGMGEVKKKTEQNR